MCLTRSPIREDQQPCFLVIVIVGVSRIVAQRIVIVPKVTAPQDDRRSASLDRR